MYTNIDSLPLGKLLQVSYPDKKKPSKLKKIKKPK